MEKLPRQQGSPCGLLLWFDDLLPLADLVLSRGAASYSSSAM